jgi:hypothetical protein
MRANHTKDCIVLRNAFNPVGKMVFQSFYHIHDSSIAFRDLVESFIERPDVRFPTVGELALAWVRWNISRVYD